MQRRASRTAGSRSRPGNRGRRAGRADSLVEARNDALPAAILKSVRAIAFVDTMGPSPLERLMTHPRLKTARELSVIVYEELFRTRAFTMAAAMSYYFLLALLPLLIFLSAMLGYLPIPNLFDQLLDILAVVVPPQAMQMVQRILAKPAGSASWRAAVFRPVELSVDRFRRLCSLDRSAECRL